MKTSFTKGTWTVDSNGEHSYIRADLSEQKHLGHEEVVAKIYRDNDAQLIAAAPELLDALDSICKSGILKGKKNVALATKMIRALAKATGGAK